MLERRHYELMAKYDASENMEFDANELAVVCGVLNLHFTDFTEGRLSEYRTAIVEAIHEQNKALTGLSEYLNLIMAVIGVRLWRSNDRQKRREPRVER
jgi:hypothetical protein